MTYDNSWIITCGLCCIYPIAFYLAVTWFMKRAKLIDWQNIRFPWSKQ